MLSKELVDKLEPGVKQTLFQNTCRCIHSSSREESIVIINVAIVLKSHLLHAVTKVTCFHIGKWQFSRFSRLLVQLLLSILPQTDTAKYHSCM